MLKPFFVRHDKLLKRVHPEEVVFIETVKNYINIVFSDRDPYMVRSTMADALKKLPPDLFIRIHRTTVVSVYYIDDIDRDHLVIGDKAFAIGRQYYKSVIAKLNLIG